MKVIPQAIADVLVIEPKVFGDERGFFFESFNRRQFAEITGRDVDFVQDNHSRSAKNVLRGLHYQIQHPQGKLVRVVQGVVFDVAVDIRKSSPTFGQYVGVELSAENKRMFWVPDGFAHGFVVLSDTADFVVIEGCKAGGHLGFAEADLLADKCQTLDEILPEVLAEVQPFEVQFGHPIPVFVAGGVYTGADMAHFTKMGAAGVQLATRFIPTYECDASQTYKDVLLHAKPEDVRIIHSPVGMPGRALNTPLVQALAEGKRFPPKHCARCLKTCDPAKVPYCITHALIEAVKGNVEEGLFFCGANVGRLSRMYTVRELMDELVTEWRQNQ